MRAQTFSPEFIYPKASLKIYNTYTCIYKCINTIDALVQGYL